MSGRRGALQVDATSALLPAALFFYFGWLNSFDADGTTFYNVTVHLYNWTLRLGCIVFVAIAGLYYIGLTWVLLLDAIVTAWCGLVFLTCGINWTSNGYTSNGFLNLIFAVVFGSAARHYYQAWKAHSGPGRPAFSAVAAPPPPAHPASIRPDVLPPPDQPAPPGGYLAALAREKEEPPRADHE